MFLLKIPIVALFLLVRWAIGQTPEEATGGDGGTGRVPRPLPPHHPRAPLPRMPRRGPHGTPSPFAPARIRGVALSVRQPHR